MSIGSLQLRLRTTAPTVDAVHNAAMAAEEAAPGEAPLNPADSYSLQNNPAVLQVCFGSPLALVWQHLIIMCPFMKSIVVCLFSHHY